MAGKLGSVAFFVGSRANYGRLKSVIEESRKVFDVKVILGASGLWENIEADEYISCLVSGDTTREMALTSGLLHIQATNILDRLNPDCLFVHGDRYEVLNVAQVAAYMNIPVCHTEGGELTGTIDDKVRYAISSLSTYHFPVTNLSASRLLFARNKNIHVVGSTAIDNLKKLKLDTENKGYILVLMHPNTTDYDPIEPLVEAVQELAKNHSVIWINPNVDAGSNYMLKKIHGAGFEIVKGLLPEEYYRKLAHCSVLVGNTSSGIKEGAYLGIPYVCIGKRQKDREHDINTTFATNERDWILKAVHKEIGKRYPPSFMFGDGTAGEKIVSALL